MTAAVDRGVRATQKDRPRLRKAADIVGKILKGELDEQKALALTKRDGRRIARHGLSLLAAGDNKGAEACGRIATHADAAHAPGWFVLGCASARLDKPTQAIVAYQQAAKLDPKHLRTQIDLAELYLGSLQYALAAACLDTVRTLDPHARTPSGVRAKVLIVKTLMTLEGT